jgi:hypothetical protein
MLAPLIALLLAAQPPGFDASAYRAAAGPDRFAAEIQRLRVEQDETHYVSIPRAERLAALVVADRAATPQAYRQDLATLRAWRDAHRANLAATVAGTAPAGDDDNVWARAAAAADDDDLRALYRRTRADQLAFGGVPDRMREPALGLYWAEQRALNVRNVAWLRSVLARIGWFDARRYGEQASLAAWLIIQHADHDRAWQAAMLEDLRVRAARGELAWRHVAYLTDRVAVNHGRPQVYGTQARCVGGDWRVEPVIEPEALDRRRADMAMESMADYRARAGC